MQFCEKRALATIVTFDDDFRDTSSTCGEKVIEFSQSIGVIRLIRCVGWMLIVPAAAATSNWCSTHGYLTLSRQNDGFIPLSRASPGARRCPWKIDVDANQRIEFSVLAFGLRQFQTGGRRRGGSGYCAWSLVFEEGSENVEESLCRVSGKETIFYTSTTSSVTAYLLHKQNQPLPGVFILRFRGMIYVNRRYVQYFKFNNY